MSYIRCRHLSVGYGGKAVAKDLSFDLNPGDYLCLVGMNGAGKSTLMKTLLGLLDPVSGEIEIGDGLKSEEIGYLPQQSAHQKNFPATVWEVAMSGTAVKNRRLFYSREAKDRCEERLRQVGMWDMRKSSYRNLSGGQKQRTLLARALCAASKILILDEPVAGLDPAARNQLYQITGDLHAAGVTIMMITHDLKAMEYASYVLHVGRKQHFFGTREDYQKSLYWKTLQAWEEEAMDL